MKNMNNNQWRNTSKLLLLPPKRACAAVFNSRHFQEKPFENGPLHVSTYNALHFIYTPKRKESKDNGHNSIGAAQKTRPKLYSVVYLSGQSEKNHIKKAIKRTLNKSVFERIFCIEFYRSLLPLLQQQQQPISM